MTPHVKRFLLMLLLVGVGLFVGFAASGSESPEPKIYPDSETVAETAHLLECAVYAHVIGSVEVRDEYIKQSYATAVTAGLSYTQYMDLTSDVYNETIHFIALLLGDEPITSGIAVESVAKSLLTTECPKLI